MQHEWPSAQFVGRRIRRPGVLASEGWRKAWRSPSRDPGAFSGQRPGRKTPWRCKKLLLCVGCSGDALLGDVLRVSRSIVRDLLSVLPIYPKIFLRVFAVCGLLIGILLCCCMFVRVTCFRLVVSTCQVSGWKDSSDDAWGGDYLQKAQCIFVRLICLCCYVYVHVDQLHIEWYWYVECGWMVNFHEKNLT